ncbi:MAG: ATPase, T2SS/T4P/T4SS family, partial [Candidatus Thermoplasmatota archaeon]
MDKKRDAKLREKTKNSEKKPIEEKVDEILNKNKHRINNIINSKNLSPSRTDENKIYYVTEDSDKKDAYHKEISKKIMDDARKKLGEKPTEENKEKTEDKKKKKKKKRHFLKRRKPKKEVDDLFEQTSTSKTEDQEKTTTDIDQTIDQITEEKKEKPKDLKDEKIETRDDIKTDEDLDFLPLEETKEETREADFSSEIEEETDTTEEKEADKGFFSKIKGKNFFGKKQKSTTDEKKAEPESFSEKSEDKKVLFKKKGWLKKKKKEKEETHETLDDEEVKRPSDVMDFSTPDVDEDESELLNEKIEEANVGVEDSDETDMAQEKAEKLAHKHLEDQPSDKEETDVLGSFETNEKEEEQTGFIDTSEDNSDHEHVFFDEGDVDEEDSFSGWSPQVPETEKKKIKAGEELESPTPDVEPDDARPDLSTQGLKNEVGGDVELPREILQVKSATLSDLGFSEEEWEELDFYNLCEPFAYVEILREKDSMEKCYFLVEVDLTEDEKEVMEFIMESLYKTGFETEELEKKTDDEYLYEKLDQIIEEYNININEESKNKIFYYIGKIALGLGKIDPLLKDPNIEDISCDGAGVPLFLYHRKYGSLKSNVVFETEEELSAFVHKLSQKCGRHVSIADPMLDATMPDGSRVQMTLSDEITAKGSTFTIRKFREDPFSPPDLVEFNTMSPEMVAYMWISVENGINALFAGGTASGKTTTLNALSLFIPRESKIVSIEETREINLPHPNWIP